MAEEDITLGIISSIQTFGDQINLHPHLDFLVTESGVDNGGIFHKIPHLDDSRPAELFCRGVLAFLVGKQLLSPEWAEQTSPGGTSASTFTGG
jgi:hypothetical protein